MSGVVPDLIEQGEITTQNLDAAGTATAGSAVEIATEGRSVLVIQTHGTYTGALTVQGTVNNNVWVSFAGSHILNINTNTFAATITTGQQGIFMLDITGLSKVRVTGLAAMTGRAGIVLRVTDTPGPIWVAQGNLATVSTVSAVTNITNWGNIVDNAAFTDGTTRLMPGGYIYDEVAGTALTENDAAAARIDAKRAQIGVIEDATTRGRRLAITAGGAMATTPVNFSSTTNTSVAGSASSVQLVAANSSRKELTIQNDSNAILYVKEGTTASATDYKFKLYPDDIYRTNNYTGRVDGIWASATGNARIAES